MMLSSPAPIEVERHLVGAMLLSDPEALAVGLSVPAKDFADERHRVIAHTIRKMDEDRRQVDLVGLKASLEAAGLLGRAGGEEFLFQLSVEVVSAAMVGTHAEIVRRHAVRRRMDAALVQVLTTLRTTDAPEEELQAAVEAVVLEQVTIGEDRGLVPFNEVLAEGVRTFERRVNGEKRGVQTGLADVDRILMGLEPSTLNVLAARPAMGKSGLAMQIALHVARTTGQAVACYTLEMLAQEQVERAMAMQDGRLDSYALSDAFQLKEHRDAILQAIRQLRDVPIWMNDSSSITPPKILRQCRSLHRRHPKGLAMIVVDYLQLVESNGKHESRQQEVSSVSKYLKRIANELRVPVLAVAAINRGPELRPDKRPILSDLKESGQIESDAHKILFLYRDEVYKACEENQGIAELIIRKNKNGREGWIPLAFLGRQTMFRDLLEADREAYKAWRRGAIAQAEAPPTSNPHPKTAQYRGPLPSGDQW